jgi:membrane fusion protein (multidrug efflux system)
LAAAERNYDGAVAKVREAEATNIKAQTDVERYRPLAEKDEVPREPLNSLTSAAQARTGPAQAMQQAYARIYASVPQQAAVLAFV